MPVRIFLKVCSFAFVGLWLFINVNHPSIPRLDPPGQAISTATQELLRLAEANPNGIPTFDPVNDLHLKTVDVVEGVMRQRVLQDSIKNFHCIHSPTFTEQVCLPYADFYFILIIAFLFIPNVSSNAHSGSHFVCILHNDAFRLPDCIYGL